MLVHFFLVALYWCVILKIENCNGDDDDDEDDDDGGDDDNDDDDDTIGWPPKLL